MFDSFVMNALALAAALECACLKTFERRPRDLCTLRRRDAHDAHDTSGDAMTRSGRLSDSMTPVAWVTLPGRCTPPDDSLDSTRLTPHGTGLRLYEG